MLDLKSVLELHKRWLSGNGGTCANLSSANLSGVDLSSANLSSANLSGVDLSSADLRSANLSGVDLRCSNLRCSNLRSANLSSANLSGADLSSANLSGADLSGADLGAFQIVPRVGQFRAYKKVYALRGAFAVIELLISRRAARTSTLVGRKCRASRVKVLRALNSPETKFLSIRDPRFVYEVGKWVEVEDYDPDIRVECTRGIHFFLTQEEALAY